MNSSGVQLGRNLILQHTDRSRQFFREEMVVSNVYDDSSTLLMIGTRKVKVTFVSTTFTNYYSYFESKHSIENTQWRLIAPVQFT